MHRVKSERSSYLGVSDSITTLIYRWMAIYALCPDGAKMKDTDIDKASSLFRPAPL